MKFAFALLKLLQKLPFVCTDILCKLLAPIAWTLAKKRRRIGLINLRLCFPEKSEAERVSILKSHFYHMLRMVFEYSLCWFAPNERIRQLVTIKNEHYLKDLRAQGEDVILFYPHFTAFEICCLRLNMDYPVVSVYSHQKNKDMDAMLYAGRNRMGNAKIISRQENLRTIIKAMREDHTPFLYLPDQDLGAKDSIFVPFFKEDAATITGLSRIAKLAKAKVVPMIAKRTKHGFELEIFPAWDNYPSADLVADTRRMNAFLEERVLEHIEQYYWLHKRFKTRPEGEASFY